MSTNISVNVFKYGIYINCRFFLQRSSRFKDKRINVPVIINGRYKWSYGIEHKFLVGDDARASREAFATDESFWSKNNNMCVQQLFLTTKVYIL